MTWDNSYSWFKVHRLLLRWYCICLTFCALYAKSKTISYEIEVLPPAITDAQAIKAATQSMASADTKREEREGKSASSGGTDSDSLLKGSDDASEHSAGVDQDETQ